MVVGRRGARGIGLCRLGCVFTGGVWGDVVRHYIYKHKKKTDGVFWALPLGCHLSPVTPHTVANISNYFMRVCDRGVNINDYKRSLYRYP